MEENLQINDISNETGNIGQNQSADSLFQSTGSNNLDLTFIDTAMTPLAEPKEPTQSSKPSGYKVVKGSEAYAGFGRAAGGDSSDDSDDDSGSDDDDDDSGWAGEGNEAFERAFERASKENERREREREKAEKEEAERAKERERARKERGSSGGETETETSTDSGSVSGGGSDTGPSEYANDADDAYIESGRAYASAAAAMGKAQEAYDNYKETLANEKQAEANVKTATEKLTVAQEELTRAQDVQSKYLSQTNEIRKELSMYTANPLSDKLNITSSIGSNINIDAKKGTIEIETSKGTYSINKGTGEMSLDGKPVGEDYTEEDAISKVFGLIEKLVGPSEESKKFAEDLQADIKFANKILELKEDLTDSYRTLMKAAENVTAAKQGLNTAQAELTASNQALAQAQQAKQEALATATQAVHALDKANAAAEAALNKYVEASKGAVEAVESAKERMNAPIDDNSSYNADPGDSETTANSLVIPEDVWSREIKEVPDPLKGTPIGDCLQEFYDIFNNYNSEINADAYQHWWNNFVTHMKTIWGTSNSKAGFLSKVANTVQGVWSALKAVKSIFKGRTEGHIVEFGKRCLSLLLNVGIAVMTGGASIPVQTTTTIIKQLWKNLKNDVVDSDLNQILENPNSEGGDYEYYDTYKAIVDDADAKWQLPSELGENYVAGKRSNNYSDYNYGLESDDRQKGQLYSDEDVKGFITKVYRKSPTIYKLKLN